MINVQTAGQLLDFGARIGAGPRADEQLHGAVAIHNILEQHRVAYLADEVGMGKTYVALGALALFMSSVIRQLENFAGVMNFVIFPMFFASSALYPLWRIKESSPLLYEVCRANPFTYAVELIRFALYGQLEPISLAVVAGFTAVFLAAAIFAYNPSKGLLARRGEPGAGR